MYTHNVIKINTLPSQWTQYAKSQRKPNQSKVVDKEKNKDHFNRIFTDEMSK